MNKKRTAIICIALMLFCTLSSLYTQEKYLSQSDIDAFIANLDNIGNDDVMDNPNVAISEPVSTAEFVAMLGDFKATFATALQNYGLNSNYPVEAFYTILVGTLALQFDAEAEVMLLQAKTEKERQMLNYEMLNSFEYSQLIKQKESIHPDDLSLLIENYRFLNLLLGSM